MLRGRIVRAHGVPAEEVKHRPDVAWVLQSDRGFTYTNQVPAGSRVVAGDWWSPDYEGPPLVSFDKRIAEGLGLKLGDEITVNVLGRDITARISNLRNLDWQSLGINFIMVYTPATFRGAPAMHLATLTYPGGGTVAEESAMLKAVADAFPSITAVRVKDAIEAVGGLVSKLVLAIRGASLITLIAAALVLGGALAAGHRHRVYDAVILKTLGASRQQLITAYALEYLLLGLATAIFGVAVGSIAAWRVVTDIMSLGYVWLAAPAAAAALGALAVTSHVRACRHIYRAWPQAGAAAPQPLIPLRWRTQIFLHRHIQKIKFAATGRSCSSVRKTGLRFATIGHASMRGMRRLVIG